MAEPLIEIEGEYKSLRWSADDGSFMIAALSNGITIVGAANPNQFIRGIEYRFSGRWEDHKSFGKQFKFMTCIAKEPVTSQAVMAYLRKYLHGSGSGIGEVKSRKLIADVGAARVIDVLKANPGKVAEVAEITKEQAEIASKTLIAVEKWEHTRMQLVTLLEGRGFSQKCIDQAITDFGVCAAEKIRRDPFTMLVRKYPSAGFLRCDQLYRDLGLPEHKLKRQVICLWHLINQANGSVWINAETAIGELRRLISSSANPKRAIVLGRRANWLSTRRDEKKKLWIAESQESKNEWIIKDCVGAIFCG